MLRMTALAIITLCVSGPSLAVTIHVPGDQPTIAAGLAAAVAGDIVLVAEGTYSEHDLVMPSGVTLQGETGSADDVVVDAKALGRVMLVSGCDASTRIEAVTFQAGWVELGGPTGYQGGGIDCRSSQLWITRCLFRANHADQGGGMHCGSSHPILTECRFEENSAGAGGGVHVSGSSSPEFHACTFSENVVETDGGAMFVSLGGPLLEDCILTHNRAYIWGGGIYAQGEQTPHLLGCTLVENQATMSWGSALFTCGDCHPLIENTLVAFNSGDGAINAYDLQSLPVVTCCDVYGNDGGNYGGVLGDQTGLQGNISADPRFCNQPDRDFTLWDDSPCLPANNECQVLIGALPQGCGSGMGVSSETATLLEGCLIPNPYVAGSTIALHLPPAASASFSLYDAQGRCVREFSSLGCDGMGAATLRWDGRDRSGARLPTGLYFYRLEVGAGSAMGRIQLVY
jgi:hypothetical protein